MAEVETVLVKYNSVHGGLLSVPLELVGEAAVKAPNIGSGAVVRLIPGWNEVAVTDWERMEPHITDRIESKEIEIQVKRVTEKQVVTKAVRKTVAGKDGKPDTEVETEEQVEVPVSKMVYQDLTEVRVADARQIVEGCFDVQVLKKWANEPKLETEVRHAAQIQLEKCLKGDVEEEDKKK